MDEEKYKKKKKKFEYEARRFGFTDQTEDIVQEAMLQFIKTPNRKANTRQYIIDAVRKLFGRPSDLAERRTSQLSLNGIDFSEYDDEILSSTDLDMADLILKIDIKKIYTVTTIEERLLFFLKEIGFTESEISILCGKSQPWVSSRLKNISEALVTENFKWKVRNQKKLKG